jgi:hypothetical protein
LLGFKRAAVGMGSLLLSRRERIKLGFIRNLL